MIKALRGWSRKLTNRSRTFNAAVCFEYGNSIEKNAVNSCTEIWLESQILVWIPKHARHSLIHSGPRCWKAKRAVSTATPVQTKLTKLVVVTAAARMNHSASWGNTNITAGTYLTAECESVRGFIFYCTFQTWYLCLEEIWWNDHCSVFRKRFLDVNLVPCKVCFACLDICVPCWRCSWIPGISAKTWKSSDPTWCGSVPVWNLSVQQQLCRGDGLGARDGARSHAPCSASARPPQGFSHHPQMSPELECCPDLHCLHLYNESVSAWRHPTV